MTHVVRPLLVTGALVAALAACSDDDTDAVGVPRAEAACQPIVTDDYTVPASGSNHVPLGSAIDYDAAPPAAAVHWDSFPQGSALKNLYHAEDRPPVPDMLHLNEHGYNVLWYDETIADDSAAMDDLESIADAYPVGEHLVIAPWTADDGPVFPGDAHVALTHWTGPPNERGVWEYCGKVSGEVVDEFTAEYPKSDSPEPTAP